MIVFSKKLGSISTASGHRIFVAKKVCIFFFGKIFLGKFPTLHKPRIWLYASMIWWPIRTKHFPKSKNTSQNPKHFTHYKTLPRIQNTSHTTKHFPESFPRIQSTSQNPKTLPRIQNTSHTTKHLPESKTLPTLQNTS